MIARRDFLKFGAAGPFVFGLSDLAALPQALQEPSWWKEALARMKESGRPGLVFIAPGPQDRNEALGQAILDLLESEDFRAEEMFCAAVTVCLGPDAARAVFGDEGAAGRILILDPDTGKPVEWHPLDMDELKSPEAFERYFSLWLNGEADDRLARRAERIRAKLSGPEKSALAELHDDLLEKRDRAFATLAPKADRLMALLLNERRMARVPEREARYRALIAGRFRSADEKAPGPRLPFGVRIDPATGGCAAGDEGTIIQCGMARMEGKGRRLLRFLVS